jgi:hypothetical protein
MVTISFGNRNFMQPVGRLSMHSNFGRGGRGGGGVGPRNFSIFSFVPNMFPSSSKWVPKGS